MKALEAYSPLAKSHIVKRLYHFTLQNDLFPHICQLQSDVPNKNIQGLLFQQKQYLLSLQPALNS
jgi:hypothetical protein